MRYFAPHILRTDSKLFKCVKRQKVFWKEKIFSQLTDINQSKLSLWHCVRVNNHFYLKSISWRNSDYWALQLWPSLRISHCCSARGWNDKLSRSGFGQSGNGPGKEKHSSETFTSIFAAFPAREQEPHPLAQRIPHIKLSHVAPSVEAAARTSITHKGHVVFTGVASGNIITAL